MERTKTAWKVVSDPYATESSWIAACAETAEEAVVPDTENTRPEIYRTYEAAVLSCLVALLGGVLAGQSVHILYYFQNVIFHHLYSNYLYAPWSDFYYWINQPNASTVYIPFFFSFSMGFLAIARNLGRMSTVVNFFVLTLYFSLLTQETRGVSGGGFDIVNYDALLVTTGIVGSALAHFFGGSIAKNLSSVTKPRVVFFALAAGLTPVAIFFSGASLSNFIGAMLFACAIPVFIGFLLSLFVGFTTRKTAVLLALSVGSPLVVCGLLHIPMAIWFAINSPIDVGGGGVPSAIRDVVYALALPTMALVLPALGALIGSSMTPSRGHALFAVPELAPQAAPCPVQLSANEAGSCPSQTKLSIKQSEPVRP